MKRCLLFLFMTLPWFFVLAGTVQSQQISVVSEVSSREVALGGVVHLNITVNGTQDVEPFTFPSLDAFDVRYDGPSRNVSIVNGNYSSSITFRYTLFAKKVGIATIPALTLHAEGQEYRTEPMDIRILEESKTGTGNATQSIEDKIFLVIKLARTTAYKNEKVPVKILLFINNLPVRNVQFPELEQVGFQVESFDKPQQYQQVIEGIRYDIVEFNTTITPTRIGEITIGPAQLQGDLLVQSQSRTGPFDDDFFNQFFNNRFDRRPLTVRSKSTTLQVKDVPAAGRPDNFSGAVGQFDIRMEANPKDLRVGDPLTVRIFLSGEGDLTPVQMPEYQESGDFKVYEPTIDETDQQKILEQVLVPKHADVRQLPPLTFSVFNTRTGQYETQTLGPVALNVQESADGARFSAVGLDQPPMPVSIADTAPLGQDIVFIKDRPGALMPAGQHMVLSVWFYILNGAGIIFWLGLLGYMRHTKRIESDPRYAKRVLAPKVAREGLYQTKQLLRDGSGDEALDSLNRTITQYCHHKFGVPSGSVDSTHLFSKLKDTTVRPETLADLQDLLEKMESIRYASIKTDDDTVRTLMDRAKHVIQEMEKNR